MRHSSHQRLSKSWSRLSLHGLLVLPFLLQTIVVVGLVGYFSHRAGQQAVNDLADRLVCESANFVEAKLDDYLEAAHHINEFPALLVELGQLDLKDIDQIEQILFAQLRHHPNLNTVLYADPQGTFRAFYKSPANQDSFEAGFANPDAPSRFERYFLDQFGNPLTLSNTRKDFSIDENAWYQAGVSHEYQGWSQVLPVAEAPDLVISAYYPVYDQRRLLGVFATKLSLLELNNFLAALDIGHFGIVFVTEADGSLIATSNGAPLFLRNEEETEAPSLTRIHSRDSQDPAIAQISAAIQGETHNSPETSSPSLQVAVNNERYFVHHRVYRDPYGLDWRITAAIPSTYLRMQMTASTRQTILFCIVALLGDLFFLLLVSRWIIRPVLHLHRGAKQLATGEFQPLPETKSFVELQELTHAFNDMAGQIQQSLNQMRVLSKQLFESEGRLLNFLDALPVGVALHSADGAVIYLNQVAQQFLCTDVILAKSIDNLAETYRAYRTGTDQLYPINEMPAAQALQGKSVVIDDLEIRQGETIIALEVRGTPIFNERQRVTYAIVVFQDITLRKKAERVLANYSRTLEERVLKRTLALEREIQERRSTEKRLRESQATQQAILTAIPDILMRLNEVGIRLSLAAEDELDPHDAIFQTSQQSIYDMLPQDLADLRMRYVRKALVTGKRQIYEHAINVEGEVIYEETRIVKLTNDEVLVMVRNVTDRKRTEEQLHQANIQLEKLARTDALTQVANRRRFDFVLEEQWQHLQQTRQLLSLILLDIDHFKLFNDTYGHPAGDDCLRRLVNAAQAIIQNSDYLFARYGGEEFSIILPGADQDTAIALANQIRTAVQSLSIHHPASPKKVVTISIGISCTMPTSESSPCILLQHADQALYAAKQKGRNCCVLYDSLRASPRYVSVDSK